MLRGVGLVMITAALGGAPVQCGSNSDPANAYEETPGEALYQLAEQFKQRGDADSWKLTLQHLVARYPSSRFAVAAKQDLMDAGIEPVAANDE
jgi:TolA-binding protein